ncbi:MAG: hypothetical protein KY433_02635 [Actinobacteria bacterium]|nr:hypothetical protein [Actinomycetota bacterium]
MCGICGLAALDGGAVDAAPLAAMSAALVHRGPDDAGALVDGPVALAARRLAIIDLAGGHQPIASEDGLVHAVQNGEILNHAALRRDLERDGHRLRFGPVRVRWRPPRRGRRQGKAPRRPASTGTRVAVPAG